ncbi:uncharacterized protein STEHIDRAFT_165709 [Stereum hirsutum FP-91666 SS1]|uniref:uncharacterized protein n=1 Tax=Stereum hirsutum (strain FP-91666) TaxID=721885 RepID=UPI000440B97F|nr:uncharacterized protein STEHIDRAFT_165709 [Stereum hirsutum FP-91666 SS1]EIM91387.1 hypothetical protein STEHIDRAFT_165709 [Stereum hirsutum FP-91666 SS1]
MPYPPDGCHNPGHGLQSTPLLRSKSTIALKRIPTHPHAPVTSPYAEASLRFSLIIPLTLAPLSSRHVHVHNIIPAVIAPTLAARPFSLSLRHATVFGVDSIQSASTFDKNASTPFLIDSSETITRSSLYIVPQGRYFPPSKSGKTRYGSMDESSLDCVDFSCRLGKEGGYLSVAQILDGAPRACLHGVNEPVLQSHGTNITLHVLWPDHTPWTTLVRTKSWKDSATPITQGELVIRLARALKRFTASAKRDVVSAATSAIPDPGDTALESLYLLSFYQVTQGGWQVELAIVAPTTNG